MTVKDLIRRDIPTVTPEMEIEVAARIMYERHLDGLAVVDGKSRLKGYVSRRIMLSVLVEGLGLDLGGCRIAVEAENRNLSFNKSYRKKYFHLRMVRKSVC